MTLDEFNALSHATARDTLLTCCACERWAHEVAAARPFASRAGLAQFAARVWDSASETERLTAFAAHPRIGDLAHLRARYDSPAQAEQGQVLGADDDVIERLAQLNDIYFERFEFIFIVCATGKSAAEMLALIEARVDNPRADELDNAAREQGRILALRLDGLLG